MSVCCHKNGSFVIFLIHKKIVAENMKNSKFEILCYAFVD